MKVLNEKQAAERLGVAKAGAFRDGWPRLFMDKCPTKIKDRGSPILRAGWVYFLNFRI